MELVVHGLINKRAELMRDLSVAKDKLAMLEADLASIEGAIRVFDPDLDMEKHRSRRVPGVHTAPEGMMARFVRDKLRGATEPLCTREITLHVMEQRGLSPSDKRLFSNMRDRTGAALYRMRKNGEVVSKPGVKRALLWSLVREPERQSDQDQGE